MSSDSKFECDNLQDAYDKLYQLSEELTKNNYKLNKKMNMLVKEKSKTDKVIIETHYQINVLTGKLAVCEKEKENLAGEFKTLMGINSKLDRDIDRKIEEKKFLETKIAKLETELSASNNAIKKMNASSNALDEIDRKSVV